MSLLEQVCNVGSGFFISLLVWTYWIVPVYDFEVNVQSNIMITVIFTAVSIVRGYAWRRLFSNFFDK